MSTAPATPGGVNRDRQIVRDLARLVAQIGALPIQAQRARLWTACNDLKPERAMVLATQQPTDEMDKAWLKMECQAPFYRDMESQLRHIIMHHEHIPDDFPIVGEYKVFVPIHGAGYGDYGFDLLATHSTHAQGAYHIEPVIQSEKDLEKLHFRPIRVDHEAGERAATQAQEVLGDILPVRKIGKTFWRYGLSRVLIHMRGLEQMMLDLYDNPELMHRLMAFLRDDFLNEIDIMEAEGIITQNTMADAVTGSGGLSPTTALAPVPPGQAAQLRDCICWAESQETVGVGPEQFDEFVLQYQVPLMERFGLTDYGCCESLDYKMDLLTAKIPNLRWVAVAPWANRQVCAEKIGKKYVYVYKPNPSRISSPKPDWESARKDIAETLQIARGCAIHICMKDTKTFFNEPQRTTQWCEMAVRLAEQMS